MISILQISHDQFQTPVRNHWMQWWEKMLAVKNQYMLATTNIPPDANQSQEEF